MRLVGVFQRGGEVALRELQLGEAHEASGLAAHTTKLLEEGLRLLQALATFLVILRFLVRQRGVQQDAGLRTPLAQLPRQQQGLLRYLRGLVRGVRRQQCLDQRLKTHHLAAAISRIAQVRDLLPCCFHSLGGLTIGDVGLDERADDGGYPLQETYFLEDLHGVPHGAHRLGRAVQGHVHPRDLEQRGALLLAIASLPDETLRLLRRLERILQRPVQQVRIRVLQQRLRLALHVAGFSIEVQR
mmetsp:Transcript_122423/g.353876  ORF Transcript_122423/g.353876 Transcript_122423/m.353876 type:complete len:243 (-) Transcript_122423:214-942(-)